MVSGLDMRAEAEGVVKHGVHPPGHEVRQCLSRRAVGDVLRLHPAPQVEQRLGEVPRRAVARGGEGEGAPPREREEFARIRMPSAGGTPRITGRRDEGRDRREVAHGIETLIGVERGVDPVRAVRAEEERVAVRRAPRDGEGAEVAARARPVVHDAGLPRLPRDGLREDAAEDVGGGARAKGTTRRMGRFGHAPCARAGTTATGSSGAARRRGRRRIMRRLRR
jgi:hypothetical protein